MTTIDKAGLTRVAEQALDSLGVEPDNIGLVQFEDNAVFRVGASGRDLMLRVSFSGGRTLREQLAEQRWLDRISGGGRPLVPRPARFGAGTSVAHFQQGTVTGTAAMFEWVAGVASPPLDELVSRAWGRATAELHAFSRTGGLVAGSERPTWTAQTVIFDGPSFSTPSFPSGSREVIAEVQKILRPMQETADDALAVIHADLHVGNIVLSPDHVVGIIDFDDCGFGEEVFDVATAISSIARVSPGSFDSIASAYLSGYLEVAPLPVQTQPFAWYLVMRDFVILNFLAATDREDVLAWAGRRAEQIVEHLAGFVSSSRYPGDRAVGLGLGLW
jgi:Ser/Thr protein kinase RdoA (MazF antagonist)